MSQWDSTVVRGLGEIRPNETKVVGGLGEICPNETKVVWGLRENLPKILGVMKWENQIYSNQFIKIF